jgi:hypothetical protein
LICAEATRLFLLRRFLIHGATCARRLEATCGVTDLRTEAVDLSARSRRIGWSIWRTASVIGMDRSCMGSLELKAWPVAGTSAVGLEG